MFTTLKYLNLVRGFISLSLIAYTLLFNNVQLKLISNSVTSAKVKWGFQSAISIWFATNLVFKNLNNNSDFLFISLHQKQDGGQSEMWIPYSLRRNGGGAEGQHKRKFKYLSMVTVGSIALSV